MARLSQRSKIGEPFCPYKKFYVLPVDDSMLQDSTLPAAAKIIYGRLCRYCGKKPYCWPTPETIGREVGLCERQVQKHLKLLEKRGFIRRIPQFGDHHNQESNRIELLWHRSFEHESGLEDERRPPVRNIRKIKKQPWILPDGTVNMGDPRLYGLKSWDEIPKGLEALYSLVREKREQQAKRRQGER